MHEAKYYKKISTNKVKCELCPHYCLISEGNTGICKVRTMKNGILYAQTYGKLSAVATDPVEKKPLYHYYPGKQILSIGSVGCTMHCLNCQNNDISQISKFSEKSLESYSVQDIKDLMLSKSLDLLAFTYNEPVVSYEYMLELARSIVHAGFKSVMVTNGFINKTPLNEIIPHISAFNVDLKSYSDDFYKRITGARLKPVLDTLELIKRRDKHLEITYLLIPGLNDNIDEFSKLIQFISKNYGRSQVLHISRYFPKFKMKVPPTPLSTIKTFTELAKNELDFVYPGNIGQELDSNTYCPACGNLLIERNYYNAAVKGMTGDHCAACGKEIYGLFA